MSAVMILFAFALSLVINFIQKMVHNIDEDNQDINRAERMDSYVMEESE